MITCTVEINRRFPIIFGHKTDIEAIVGEFRCGMRRKTDTQARIISTLLEKPTIVMGVCTIPARRMSIEVCDGNDIGGAIFIKEMKGNSF